DAAYKPGTSLDDQKASALADVKEHKESVSLPATDSNRTDSNRIESITGVIVATLISFMSILGVKNLKRTKK
ncbi:serine/threonine-protein kinase, partial [Fructobacillus pseudoficulneus]